MGQFSMEKPVAPGSALSGNQQREILEQEAADVVIADFGWSGGLTEAKKAMGTLEAFGIPFAPQRSKRCSSGNGDLLDDAARDLLEPARADAG
jgi:L-alanine-DL-glutamate epimerase-like enolase superfamily enzyme